MTSVAQLLPGDVKQAGDIPLAPRPAPIQAALEAGARVEAEWDGRTFDKFGRADKARYVDRLEAAIVAYTASLMRDAT